MPVPVDFTSDVVHFPARAKRLEVIEESALESDFIRDKARLVFAKFVQQNTSDEDDRLLSQQIHTADTDAAIQTHRQNSLVASDASAMFNFPLPTVDTTAMYGQIVVTPNPFSQYVSPTAHYQLREMQRITNWHHLAHFLLQGDG